MYTLCYCYIHYVTSTGPYPTGTSSISQYLTPSYRYKPYITNTCRRHSGTSPISQELVPVLSVLPTGPSPPRIYPLYHTYWSLSFRYIPSITSTGPCSTGTSQIPQYWTLSYRYIPYISNTGLCPTSTSRLSQ